MPSDLLVWHGLTKFDPLAPHLSVSGYAHREDFFLLCEVHFEGQKTLSEVEKFFLSIEPSVFFRKKRCSQEVD